MSPTRVSDFSNPQPNAQFQHNRTQGQQGGYSNNNSRSNKYPNSNSRQNNNDNYYRSNPGNSGGYNRGMMYQQQAENDEYYDPDGRYYYDQYSGGGGGYGGSRSGQNYANNYPPLRDSRNQQYNSRDTRGGQQYSDYDYDPRWGQQEVPRPRSSQSHREPYGADANHYQPDRSNSSSRDSRYPQSWAAFQESENPNQRNAPGSFYPRTESQRDYLQDTDDYRRDYDQTSLSQFNSRSQETQSSSGWLDIEGLIGSGNDNPENYGGLDSTLDLNF